MNQKEQEETDKVNLVHSLKKRVCVEYSRICRQRRQKKAALAKVSFLLMLQYILHFGQENIFLLLLQ